MVLYTFVGLSITAEPIVESRAAAEPSAVASESSRSRGRRTADAGRRSAPQGRTRAPGSSSPTRCSARPFTTSSKTTVADLALRLRVRLPVERARRKRGRSLRSVHRRRHGTPAPASRRGARGRRRRWLQVFPGRRRQFRARGLHRRGLSRCRRRTMPNGTRWWRRPGARCPGTCSP